MYGKLPRGPLAVLRENWSGQRNLPLNLGKSTVEYLEDLQKNLEAAEAYAKLHSQKAQQRYVSNYNLRSREKSFQVGEQVLILTPNSFVQKGSGNTLMRAVQQILHPIRDCTGSYVDDMGVFSNEWPLHLQHLDRFLQTIKKSGLTLNLKKCHFAQTEVPVYLLFLRCCLLNMLWLTGARDG